MRTSKAGIELIAKHEGLRLKPYLCPAGIPTIGYGNTFYEDGTPVKMTDPPITKERATGFLAAILEDKETAIQNRLTRHVNQNQFDALVSFVYNVGAGAFAKSTLLRKVNTNPNDPTIAAEFAKWNKGGGKVLPGLVKRRKEEAELYFT